MAGAPTPDQFERVRYLYDCLTPKPEDLIQRGRYWVREGPLLVWDENRRKKSKRYVFLLNDVMLITKREGKSKFWLRIFITLRSPHVYIEDTSQGFDYSMRLTCRTRNFSFYMDSGVESWVADINASIKGPESSTISSKTSKESVQSNTNHGDFSPNRTFAGAESSTSSTRTAKMDFRSFTDGDFVETKVNFDSGVKLKPIRSTDNSMANTPVPVLAPPPRRSSQSGGNAPLLAPPPGSSNSNNHIVPTASNNVPSGGNSSNLNNDFMSFFISSPPQPTTTQPPHNNVPSNSTNVFNNPTTMNNNNTNYNNYNAFGNTPQQPLFPSTMSGVPTTSSSTFGPTSGNQSNYNNAFVVPQQPITASPFSVPQNTSPYTTPSNISANNNAFLVPQNSSMSNPAAVNPFLVPTTNAIPTNTASAYSAYSASQPMQPSQPQYGNSASIGVTNGTSSAPSSDPFAGLWAKPATNAAVPATPNNNNNKNTDFLFY